MRSSAGVAALSRIQDFPSECERLQPPVHGSLDAVANLSRNHVRDEPSLRLGLQHVEDRLIDVERPWEGSSPKDCLVQRGPQLSRLFSIGVRKGVQAKETPGQVQDSLP